MGYLVYDADCGFCTKSATWLAGRGPVEIRSWQSIRDLEALGLDIDMVTAAAYWVEGTAAPEAGAVAIARALEASGGYRRPVGRVIRSRPILPLARRIYAKIAVNRHRMPGSTGACRLPGA